MEHRNLGWERHRSQVSPVIIVLFSLRIVGQIIHFEVSWHVQRVGFLLTHAARRNYRRYSIDLGYVGVVFGGDYGSWSFASHLGQATGTPRFEIDCFTHIWKNGDMFVFLLPGFYQDYHCITFIVKVFHCAANKQRKTDKAYKNSHDDFCYPIISERNHFARHKFNCGLNFVRVSFANKPVFHLAQRLHLFRTFSHNRTPTNILIQSRVTTNPISLTRTVKKSPQRLIFLLIYPAKKSTPIPTRDHSFRKVKHVVTPSEVILFSVQIYLDRLVCLLV